MTEETAHFTSTDPAEIHSTPPYRPTREQTFKTVQDKWPGHISWASDRANFAGCRVITFDENAVYGLEEKDENEFGLQMHESSKSESFTASAEELMNLYFSTRANLLVVSMTTTASSITVLVTTQMDNEDLEEFQEIQTRVNLEMREWREKRAKEKAERQAEAMEERRLIEVGRTAETYNLAGRVRELEAELAEMRKAARAP